MAYNIKNYDKNYWLELLRLYKNVFGKDLSLEYFKWKNTGNPNGKSIIKLAVSEEKLIGYSCTMKYKMNFFGKNIMAGQPVDAMVDKDYRRQNIYESLSLVALDDMKEQGLGLRFNFPNQDAFLASVKKVNIKKVCDIPQYLKVLKGKKALGMFTGNNALKLFGGSLFDIYGKAAAMSIGRGTGYSVKEIKLFDYDFDELWKTVRDDFPIAVVRSSQYLNWRYFDSINDYKVFAAYKDEKLIGYIVGTTEVKVGEKGERLILGHIADIICHRNHSKAIGIIVSALEDYFRNIGVCAVSCWMLNHWFYAQALKKLGFLQLRSPAVLAVLPVAGNIKAMGDSIYNQDSWFITIGDSDYI